MEDLDTEFVANDNEDKHQDQDEENKLSDSPNYNQPHAIEHESNSTEDTNVQKKCSSEEKKNTEKETNWEKSTNYS